MKDSSMNIFFWAAVRGRIRFLMVAAAVLLAGTLCPAQEAGHYSGWVVIPVEEYRDLRARAFPAEQEPESSPVDATLTRVDYDLRITGDLGTGRATLTVDVLKDGWVRVPIPPGLLVREARLDGKLVSLVPGASGKGTGQFSALLSHPGRAVLLLDIALPVTSSAGNESIALPSTESGITRAAIQIPRQGVEVRIAGGFLAEKSEAASESKWLAYGSGNERLTFTWRRRTEDHRASQPLRMRGSLVQLTSLGEDSTSVYAEVNLEVIQGVAREVRMHLPDKVTINQVLGAGVADWEMKNGELAVTFLEPVEQSTRFVISGETRLPRDGEMSIPLLRLLGTERETGGLAVEVLGAGEIKDLKSQGLEDADATDLGDYVASRQSPSLAAFRYRAGDPASRSLAVNVVRYAQQAVLMANVEEARYRVLFAHDGKILVAGRFAVRNNQRNFVKVTLPPGAMVWSAALAGRPVRPGQAPDGSLLLPLEKARSGDEAPAFAVEVTYVTRAAAWDEKGKVRLTLPALDLPVSRTGLVLYYPPLYRVNPEPGTFRTQAYEGPSSVALSGEEVVSAVQVGSLPFANQTEADKGQGRKEESRDATQALVDKFRARSQTGRAAGILSIRVSFPNFGPSLFLVSELTSENQTPAADFSYQREKKGSAR